MCETGDCLPVRQISVVSGEEARGSASEKAGERHGPLRTFPSVMSVGPLSEAHITKKRVSVIIPFTRPDTVGNAIESVLSQGFPGDELEIIVVGLDSQRLVQRWPQIRPVDVGAILQPGKARNMGAEVATGDFLLFLDDDCEAQEGWIRENLAELSQEKVGAVSGRVIGKSSAIFSRCVDYSNFGLCQTQKRREGRLWTATLGMRKRTFEEVGGFDRSLWVQEDIDLCFRLGRLGYRTIYAPKIKILHDHGRRTLRSFLGYLYWGGRTGGIDVEARNADASYRNRLLSRLTSPLAYLPFVLPFSMAGTLSTLLANFRENKEVLFLSPLILVGKVSCHIGVWLWTVDRWFARSPIAQGGWRLLDYSLLKRYQRTPRILTLFVTGTCNAKCQHCFYWDKLNQHDDMTLDDFRRLSHSMGKIDKLLISGGEPFLRRDLPEILGMFAENNGVESVSIPTNGLLPDLIAGQTRKILDVLHGRSITISFSVDGGEGYHDRLRGVPGNFQKLVESYRNVKSMQGEFPNLILRISTTVMQQSYDEVMQLFDEMPTTFEGVNSPCINLLRGSPYDRSLMLPTNEDILRLYEKKAAKSPGRQGLLRRLADRLTFAVAFENLVQGKQVVPCEAGRLVGVVEHNGAVRHCELLPPVGNIREASFEEIWNSEASRKARGEIVDGKCHCTHECYTFPSLMANPLHGVKLLKHLRSK
jgi:MoaA/NifB/PqqE/SkfB family radical SAM enzyme/GT2 family glycosyltransferase